MFAPLSSFPPWLKIGTMTLALALAFWSGRSLTNFQSESVAPAAEFELAPGNNGATFRFSPPRPLKRLITEWEPQRALVMTMSFCRGSESIPKRIPS